MEEQIKKLSEEFEAYKKATDLKLKAQEGLIKKLQESKGSTDTTDPNEPGADYGGDIATLKEDVRLLKKEIRINPEKPKPIKDTVPTKTFTVNKVEYKFVTARTVINGSKIRTADLFDAKYKDLLEAIPSRYPSLVQAV